MNAASTCNILKKHLSRQRNWMSQLWNVLMFQTWLEVERV